jgi:F-type H+-transporting ATPase subunit b
VKRAHRITAVAAAASIALFGALAVAQQPAPNPHGPPGQPGAQPGAQPNPHGQPPPGGMPNPGQARPLQIQPGQPPPGGQLPPGHPSFPQPGGRPGQPPPGFPRPGQPPRPRPVAHEEEEHGGGHHECEGHGPNDPPPPPNWWHGLLMTNNEKAQAGGFVNQLLFRYENEKDPCDPKNEPPPFLAQILNLGILAFILVKFGKKPMSDALVKRKQTIMADIDNATRLKDEAEERLSDYEAKLENLHETLAQLRADHAAQAEAEKKHILDEAEERRVRMRRDAEFRIEQELKQARQDLLHNAVEQAVAAAEELLQKKAAEADQQRLADEFLAALGPALATERDAEVKA